MGTMLWRLILSPAMFLVISAKIELVTTTFSFPLSERASPTEQATKKGRNKRATSNFWILFISISFFEIC